MYQQGKEKFHYIATADDYSMVNVYKYPAIKKNS